MRSTGPNATLRPSNIAVRLRGQALELCSQADPRAHFALGRLLCGIPCGLLEPRWRGEASTCARCGRCCCAADAGELRAWVHLHRLSSDHRSSVLTNPQMSA